MAGKNGGSGSGMRCAALAQMIAPHSEQSFLDTYWEKKPVILKRDAPEYWEGLMSLQAVEAMKESAGILGRTAAPFKRGVPDLPDYDDAFDAYLDGASLVMNQVDKVRVQDGITLRRPCDSAAPFPRVALFVSHPFSHPDVLTLPTLHSASLHPLPSSTAHISVYPSPSLSRPYTS